MTHNEAASQTPILNISVKYELDIKKSPPPSAPLKHLSKLVLERQGCIFRLTRSHPELTEDHVLTSAYVKIFRTVTRNAVNKSV